MTDTTLNLHRDNTLKWEISVPSIVGTLINHSMSHFLNDTCLDCRLPLFCHSFSVLTTALPKLICSLSMHSSRLINSVTLSLYKA